MENRPVSIFLYYIYVFFYRNPNKTKISKDAPKWFKIVPEWKVQLFKDDLVNKEDTIKVFSRYQNWITVDSKDQDRRKALERVRILKKDVTSRLMPEWMENKNIKNHINEDKFKLIEYNYPLRQKATKLMTYVDKDINPKILKPIIYNSNKSVFNFGDFRHNVMTQKESKEYGSQVSQFPKKFFDWDDGKKFNPKYKKDI